MNGTFSSFPSQKKSKSQKTKKWYRECIDAIDTSGFFLDEGVRQSYKEKIINTNLYNGIIDKEDVENVLNPSNIKLTDSTLPEIQYYPIINPRIEVLIGEESKRRFDYQAVVTNHDAVSEKEEELNGFVKQKVIELLNSKYEKEELEGKIKKLNKDISSFQSKREKLSNRLLKHHYREQRFDRLFNNCYKDVLVNAEEFAQADIISGKPVLKKLDPLKTFYVRSGYSNKIQDADLIILDDFWSPGQIIDTYYEQLTSKQISQLERGFGSSEDDPFVDKSYRDRLMVDGNFLDNSMSLDSEEAEIINENIQTAKEYGFNLSDTYDASGNIRVLQVFWRGWKKVKQLTYFDKFGDEQKDLVSEDYIPKEDEGETVKTLWINEWYQGVKIGTDIYVDCKPKTIQFRSIENPAYSHPGIVGKSYSFNSTKAVSVMSRVKNYLYLYSVIHHRLNELLAANQGKVLQMDFSLIPEGWDVERWLHYLKKMKVAVTDSFKEGKKGAALGKLAGGMNNASKGYLDLDQGQNIQQHIGLLEFIKQEMTEITGVSPQRLGSVSSNETVGGVERSITQSNHITEWLFAEHEQFKIEALECFLNTCSIAYKNNPKKLQYILDDTSIAVLNINPELLTTADFGIVLTSSTNIVEIEQNLKRLAESALSAGAVDFKDVANIYLADSISDIKNILNQSAEEARLERMKQIEEESKVKQKELQDKKDLEDRKLDIEEMNNIRDNETKIITSMDNGEDKLKRLDNLKMFYENLEFSKKQHQDKMKLEEKKLKKQNVKK